MRTSFEHEPPPDRPSIAELCTRLARDGEAFVRAEIRLYRAQAAHKALSAGWAIGFLALASILALSSVGALLVGLILGLVPHVGAWWATLIVVGTALALAALVAKLGIDRFAELMKEERSE